MHLTELYADFTSVIRTTEPGRAVLDNVLLPYNSQDIEVADVLSAGADTSLAAKLAAGEYSDPERFYHDMKLAFGRLIAQFPQNAPEYDELAQLFKFASDLLVREANRMGLTKLVNAEDDDYLFRLSQGFQRISAELQDYNSETFWVVAAAGPLFMSVTNKAPFDPRDTAVAGSVHTVKLMPHVARAAESTLGVASPMNPMLPQPYSTPSDLLARFVHPNVHTTMPPLWLASPDHYSTFAPTVDSAGSVIGGTDATQVWLEKSGLTAGPDPSGSTHSRASAGPNQQSNAASAAGSVPAGVPSGGPSDAPAGVPSDAPAGIPTDAPAGVPADAPANASPPAGTQIKAEPGQDAKIAAGLPADIIPSPGQPAPDLATQGDPLTHNAPLSAAELEAILRWSPYNFIDDDELEVRKADKEVELVSELLLKLQSLQRQRLSVSDSTRDISDEERRTALKVSNMLARLVEEAAADDVTLDLDPRLPVLMRNYTGSLPAATDPALQQMAPRGGFNNPQNSMRLHTIAGLRSRSRTSGRR